jgi:hypothetical protein
MARINWLDRVYAQLPGTSDSSVYYNLIDKNGNVYPAGSPPYKLVPVNTLAQTGTPHSAVNDNQLVQFADLVTSPAAGTPVCRDASGRTQFADPEASQDAATKNYVDGKTVQIGDILTTTRNNPGVNFLLCNGAQYDITLYPALSAAQGGVGQWTSYPVTTGYTISMELKLLNGIWVIGVFTNATSNYIMYADSLAGPWTTKTMSGRVYDAIYANDQFVFAIAYWNSSFGFYPAISAGSDITSLTNYSMPNTAYLNNNARTRIIWNGSVFILAGYTYVWYFATPSGSKTSVNVGNTYMRDFLYANGYYIIAGDDRIYYSASYTATSWTQKTYPAGFTTGTFATCPLRYQNDCWTIAGKHANGSGSGAYIYFTAPSSLNVAYVDLAKNNNMGLDLIWDGHQWCFFLGTISNSNCTIYTCEALTGSWVIVSSTTAGYVAYINEAFYITISNPSICHSPIAEGGFKTLPTYTINGLYNFIRAF